ncbi:MAG: GTP-binding protein Era [Rickettsiaceae bacterium]|jgi:GTP-binding protein Era|nr:GTP-binding protein Era [Rickettsiaceae bacterium]
MENKKKFSQIALIGAPNAGKSTLANNLVGQKISIVSPKVQTTRNTLKAIMVEGDTQIAFLDTPGVFIPKTNRPLERAIVRSAWQAIKEADFVCLLIDANQGLGSNNEQILKDLEFHKIKPIIAINKVDSIAKEKILGTIAALSERGFEKIFLISAATGDGVEDLKQHLISIAQEGPWQFNDDEITDAPMKFIAAEITREQLFLKLNQDLPYSLYVRTDAWEDLKNGQVKISQTISVLKESQKMIVLGKKGSMIKQIGEEARKAIGEILGTKVHLFLFVKVEEDWINKKESYS